MTMRLNRGLLERLQLGGEAFLTSTELRGRFVLRACIVNYRSRKEDVDRMLNAVVAIGRELTAAISAGDGKGSDTIRCRPLATIS